MARMRSRAATMAGSIDGHAGHLHREVDLDGRRQVGGAALEQAPAAVGVLPAAEVADGPLLDGAVGAVDEVAEQQVLGGERAIGLELADPVPVGRLDREEIRLRAGNGVLNGRHERRW